MYTLFRRLWSVTVAWGNYSGSGARAAASPHSLANVTQLLLMKLAVEYEVTTSFVIYIERDQAPTDHEDLLENITRDELANAPMDVHEIRTSMGVRGR